MIRLTQAKINTWLTCKTCFRLRYRDVFRWPKEPNEAGALEAMEMGEMFHMLAAQYLVSAGKFSVDESTLSSKVGVWWHAFLESKQIQALISGPHLKVEADFEVALIDDVKVNGRIDCLQISQGSINIFDWKTGRPRNKADLETDWQTCLYLAMVAQSRDLLGQANLPLDQISITYWYARDPDKSVNVSYSEAWHSANWSQLQQIGTDIVAELEKMKTEPAWPVTSSGETCPQCSNGLVIGRVTVDPVPKSLDDEHQSELVVEADAHPDL